MALHATPPQPTIRDVESEIEDLLNSLADFDSTWTLERSLALLQSMQSRLAPKNFKASVQLEEDGRKKRSTAVDSCWKFESGEIVIFYDTPIALTTSDQPKLTMVRPVAESPSVLISDEAVQQCCEALAEAEKTGRQFIALKWFRDLALAALPYDWAKSPERCQKVLTQAIDTGAIITKRIPNPRAPMHPTTTITLNRENSTVKVASRFRPVAVLGEPASTTLLRDRGEY